MVSLFDYLGHPAGRQLGKVVFAYSKIRKSKRSVRTISTATYNGDVMLYETEFLDEFFKVQTLFTVEDHTEVNTALIEEAFRTSDLDLIF